MGVKYFALNDFSSVFLKPGLIFAAHRGVQLLPSRSFLVNRYDQL